MVDTLGKVRDTKSGHRSLALLHTLEEYRNFDRLGVPTTRAISDLVWRPANFFAIERDTAYRGIWHAGHVSAILSTGDVAIVGTQTGGVFVINPAYGAIPVYNSHYSQSVSDDWDSVDVNVMTYAPGVDHQFYVGCADGALYLVELEPQLGDFAPKQSTLLPYPTYWDAINGIAVFDAPRRIALATNTGVWWSEIPAAPGLATGYNWKPAEGLTGLNISGIAVGPSNSIAIGVWGSQDAGTNGMYRGTWTQNKLTFTAATVNNVATGNMLRTSVTSSEADRNWMYAVSAGKDEGISCVLASSDGGKTWNPVMIPPDVGNLGFYNNCIAASPYNPSRVAIGWRSSGPFISNDGGQSWTQLRNDQNDGNMHSDLHALCWAKNSINNDRLLYVGSDGGIVVTADLGESYNSEYNKHLRNLQFYGGCFDASSRFPGLLVGGTQDNGNISCDTYETLLPSWKTLEGGDGGINRFLDEIGALIRYNNTLLLNNVEVGNKVRIDFWNETTHSFGGLGTVIKVDGTADGLTTPYMDAVYAPSFQKNGEKMYACAGTGKNVYGLFAKADGSGAHWTQLATLGANVRAITSYDGATMLVGTDDGKILQVDSATGQVTAMTLPSWLAGTGSISGIRLVSATRAMALHDTGTLLRLSGTAWDATTGSGFLAFALDPVRPSSRVFAATDSQVFVSEDNGDTWTAASQGLPRRPHCSDLRIAKGKDGAHFLYLSTYGRSVWVTQIDYIEKGPDFEDVPPLVADTLFGVLGDGGGIVRIGNKLHRIPPHEPAIDILKALAVIELAQSMSDEHARAVTRTALEEIGRIAQREAERFR
jgi:hypothetical protein